MIDVFIKYLDQGKYSFESPLYKKYSSEIYPVFIEDRFFEFKNDLPGNFEDFCLKFKSYFNGDNLNNSSTVKDFSFENLSAVIEKLEDMTTLISSSKELVTLLFGWIILLNVHLMTMISIKKRKLITSKKEILKFFEKKIQFSQTSIAIEWGVNNDTLSKWFVIMYKTNPFAKRKKINLSEYLKIYNDFFIMEKDCKNYDDGFMITDNKIDFYVSAAVKGKTYTKKEVIELGFDLDNEPITSHYTQARKFLLEKYPYYKLVNKFPNSLALELIEALKVK